MTATDNGYRVKVVEGSEKPFHVEGLPSLLTMEPVMARLYGDAVGKIEKGEANMKMAFYKMIAKGFGMKSNDDGEETEEDIINKLRR